MIDSLITWPLRNRFIVLMIAEGSYMAPGSTVLKLAELRTLWAEAQLYVSNMPFLAQTRVASVTLPYYPGRILGGKISFVNPNLEASG